MANKFKPTEYNNHLDLPVTINSVIDHIAVLRAVFNQIEAIQKEQVALMIQCNKSQRGMTSTPEINEYYDYQLSDKFRAIEFNFYRINRVSSVLNMYAYLEASMFRICQQKQINCNLPNSVLQVKDKGRGIGRCKIYLTENNFMNCSDPICKNSWDHLTYLNKLRDALAHCEGDIELTGSITEKIIKSIDGLSLLGTTIMISDNYVLNTLDRIETFLIYLCQD